MRNPDRIAYDPEGKERRAFCCLLLFAFCLLICLSPPAGALAQQTEKQAHPVPIQRPKPPEPEPAPAASASVEGDETPLPNDWAPELLDGILSSRNSEARDALLDAAFAAGPAIIPQLQAALKDDRTAEFAAQTLAFIGGPKALEILSGLMRDPRDLGLKRFYYGALAEFHAPEASNVLLEALNQAEAEPDRAVTESAIVALTVRSDANLIPQLRRTEGKIKDFVLHDDLDNAIDVMEARARLLAAPRGPQAKRAGGSVEQAVRTYFLPALESASPSQPSSRSAPGKAGFKATPPLAEANGKRTGSGSPTTGPKTPASRKPVEPLQPPIKIEIEHLALSPDKSRALARVSFEDPAAIARYSIVLQKQAGDWTVASVWLGSEVEKAGTSVNAAPSSDDK
jgi:hypothetical protein